MPVVVAQPKGDQKVLISAPIPMGTKSVGQLYQEFPQLQVLDEAWNEFLTLHHEVVKTALLLPNGRSGVYRRTPTEWIPDMAERFGINRDSRFLDIGGGNGLAAFSIHILTGAQVHSVEIDPRRFAVLSDFQCFARDRGLSLEGVSFQQADVLEIPFSPYDVVYFFATLPMHMKDLGNRILTKVAQECGPQSIFISPNFLFEEELQKNGTANFEGRSQRASCHGMILLSEREAWDSEEGKYEVLIAGRRLSK